ncbi:hypothetical protein CKK33_01720 [Mucilaginibacter sp. MD40]|nr:hypothetical protein CKK33_01720 [Mucilaginibacter sp. MD40]
MLTLYDFNVLPEDEKADAVWSGTFLADREENDLKVQLYSVSCFYVEVYYDPVANKILRFRAFSSRDLLTPYLAQIKLI